MDISKHRIIIDNSVLVNWAQIKSYDLIELCKVFFYQILIPMKVYEEYKVSAQFHIKEHPLLRDISPAKNIYRLCSSYDAVTYDYLRQIKKSGTFTKIDDGEAEGVAQFQKVPSLFFLTDDQKFVDAANYHNIDIKLTNTLYIIALLDIYRYVDYNLLVKEFYSIQPFTARQLRDAYTTALSVSGNIGIFYNKKLISAKTSFSKIGLLN